jgi:hypothetical protein
MKQDKEREIKESIWWGREKEGDTTKVYRVKGIKRRDRYTVKVIATREREKRKKDSKVILRERERERERLTDRERERKRQRLTNRQRERKREKEILKPGDIVMWIEKSERTKVKQRAREREKWET